MYTGFIACINYGRNKTYPARERLLLLDLHANVFLLFYSFYLDLRANTELLFFLFYFFYLDLRANADLLSLLFYSFYCGIRSNDGIPYGLVDFIIIIISPSAAEYGIPGGQTQ